jgi:hypothetical protein
MSSPSILKDESFLEAPSLKRELNAVLGDLQQQIDDVAGVQLELLEPITFTAPFVAKNIGGPAFGSPSAVWIGKKENLTSPATVFAAAVELDWLALSDGRLSLRAITGLTSGQQYRITLVAMGVR